MRSEDAGLVIARILSGSMIDRQGSDFNFYTLVQELFVK